MPRRPDPAPLRVLAVAIAAAAAFAVQIEAGSRPGETARATARSSPAENGAAWPRWALQAGAAAEAVVATP